MMHVKFDTQKIVDQFQKKALYYAGIDIDTAVHETLDELADILLKMMQEGVSRHYAKGDAYKAVERTEVQRAGNTQWVEVGAMRIRSEHQDGFHVIYQEYGSPSFGPADPWLRPVMENKAIVRKTILAVFERWNVPNVKAA